MDLKRERDLLESWAEGDGNAVEILICETYALLYGLLYRLADGQESLAVSNTREAYRQAWNRLYTFEGRSSFTSWLYRIAYNVERSRPPLRLVRSEEQWLGSTMRNLEDLVFEDDQEIVPPVELFLILCADVPREVVVPLPDAPRNLAQKIGDFLFPGQ